MKDTILLPRGKEIFIRVLYAFGTVWSVSGLVELFGLYDRIYFNKSLLSPALFLLCYVMAGRFWEQWRQERRNVSIALALAFVLMAAELLGTGLRLMVNGASVTLSAAAFLCLLESAALLSVSVSPVFCAVFRMVKESRKEQVEKRTLKRVFLGSWLAVFLCYLPCLLAFYPGLYSYDMVWQWQMFLTGDYSTHHPIIHTVFSSGLIELGNKLFGSYYAGLAFHGLVQLLLLSGCIAFSVRYLVKTGVPKAVWILALLFYMLFPFFPVLGISTTKDVLFGGLLLVVFVCICDMADQRAVYRGRFLALFLTALTLMCLFRNNAVFGLLFVIACLVSGYVLFLVFRKKKKKLLAFSGLFLAGVVLAQVLFPLMTQAVHAKKGSAAEMLSIPCQQLARVYVYHEEEIEPSEKEELFSYIPEEALGKYKYYVSDPVKAGLNVSYLEAGHQKDFFKLWLRIGKQFPGEYLLATLYNTMGIWYLGGDSSCFVLYEMNPSFDKEHKVEFRSVLPGLKDAYSWFTDENIQRHLPMVSILFYTSFYTWMVLGAAFVIVAKRRYVYLIPVLFLTGYILTLIPGPCITVRYLMGVMLCIPVLLSLVFTGMKRETRTICNIS